MADPIFARRLARAQYLAQSIVDKEPTKATKKKQRDGHRVLGQRQCLCGEWFNYTTKRPEKKSCGRYCSGRSQALADSVHLAAAEQRIERFRSQVTDIIRNGHISVGTLVDLCSCVYRSAYRSGYKQGRLGYHSRQPSS